MNNIQKIFSSFKKTASASWDSIFLRNIQLGDAESVKQKPYTKSTIVYVCVSTTARTIAQCPLIIMKKTNIKSNSKIGIKTMNRVYRRESGRDGALTILENNAVGKGIYWEQVYEDDPWQQVFTRPNYLMSCQDFMETAVSHLMLKGNVWAVGLPYETKTAPLQIWPIRKENIEVIKNGAGQLEGWKYKPNEGDAAGWPIHIDELIAHVRYFNPEDFIMGLDPLSAGEIPLSGEYKAAKYNEKFFDNSAMPLGALTTDSPIPETERAKLREQWRQRHGGYEKAHEIAILHSGLKYQQIGLTQADMQYIEYRRWTRDEICQLFGTKKGVISITEDLNYSTLTGQKSEWWESTLIPMICKFENSYNSGLLKNNPNIKVVSDLSNVKALQEDMEKKSNIARTFWNMAVPFNQINEKLELGFDPMPWHDTGYLPFSLNPATGLPKGNEEDKQDQKIDADNSKEEIDEDKPQEDQEEDKKIISYREGGIITPDASKYLLKDNYSFIPRITVKSNWEERAEKIWKGIVRRTDKFEDEFESKTRRLFLEMRGNVLSILYTGDPKKSKHNDIIKDLTPEELKRNIKKINEYNFKKEKELLKKYSEGYYEKAIESGADTLIDEVGIDIDFDMEDPLVVDFIKNKVNKVTGITDTVKDQIKDAISAGQEEGEGIKGIADRIRTQFNFANTRARMIARTEVFGANNFGRYAAMQDSGFKKKKWFTARDDRTRSIDNGDEFDHVAMHGTEIGMDENWVVPGKNSDDEIRFPADPAGQAGNLINCRCVEIVSK